MDNIKIKEIIERHQHWLRKDCNDWENMRADLCRADLSGANLSGANLRRANLYKADLYKADLSGAGLREVDLYDANLRVADLHGADLYGANLYKADLYRADLREVDLREVDLYRANLSGTDLSGANLHGADLYGANLSETDLSGANLYKANLYDAMLYGARNVPFIPYVCPDFGAFTGFKKAHGFIVVLEIPEDAQRSSATGRKCRCDKAKVIDIQNMDGTKANVTSVSSDRDNNFVYKIGEEVRVLDFDKDRWHGCSTGIHFFINRQEAVDYV